MGHPFRNANLSEELLRFCTVAWADDLSCPFVSLARTCSAFAAVARTLRAEGDGCVEHSCAARLAWRGAVDLPLLGKYLKVEPLPRL